MEVPVGYTDDTAKVWAAGWEAGSYDTWLITLKSTPTLALEGFVDTVATNHLKNRRQRDRMLDIVEDEVARRAADLVRELRECKDLPRTLRLQSRTTELLKETQLRIEFYRQS